MEKRKRNIMTLVLMGCIFMLLGCTDEPYQSDVAMLQESEAIMSENGDTTPKQETRGASQELEGLEIHYIDVGQGDATLIKCGEAAMLIDAGDNNKGTAVQLYLKNQGVEKLDYMILTHPDADHIGGADVILTKYDIDTIIMPNYEKDTATYRNIIQAMDYKHYKNTEPVVGTVYSLQDAEFTIIAPNDSYGNNANNYSVGLLLKHGNNSFLFTGDAEEEAEKDIINNGTEIKADVLKAGHHGSKMSSTEEFLDKVEPEFTVFSCKEDNTYGHPHAAVLNNLRSRGVKVFRTDEQGSVVASSDGMEISWNCAPSDTWKAGEPIGSSISDSETERDNNGNTLDTKDEINDTIEENAITVISYVLNTNTKKFHKLTCASLPTANRLDSDLERDEIVESGYEPCKRCNP